MTEQQYKDAIALYHPAGGNKVGKIYDVRDTTQQGNALFYGNFNLDTAFTHPSHAISVDNSIEHPGGSSDNIFKLVGNGGNGLSQSNVIYTVQSLNISLFAKASNGGRYLFFRGVTNGSHIIFDLVDGIITYGAGLGSITNEGNGWFRCSYSHASGLAEGRFYYAITTTSVYNSGTGNVATVGNTGMIIHVTGLNMRNTGTELLPFSRQPKLDLTVTGGGGTRINKQGNLEEIVGHQPKIDYGTGQPAFLIEPTRTNSESNSYILTGWTRGSSIIENLNQVGITGISNTALYLEDANIGGYGYLERGNRTLNTGIQKGSVWIKKDQVETRFPEVHFRWTRTSDGGFLNSIIQLNTKTGVIVFRNGTNDNSVTVLDRGGWWEIVCITLENCNALNNLWIYPALGSTIGTVSNNTLGSIVVGHVGVSEGNIVDETPIITNGAIVTRTGNLIATQISSAPIGHFSVYYEGSLTDFDNNRGLVFSDPNNNNAGVAIRREDGTGYLQAHFPVGGATVTSTVLAKNINKVVMVADKTAFRLRLTINGVFIGFSYYPVKNITHFGNYDTNNTQSNTVRGFGEFKEIKIWNKSLTDQEAIDLTTI